MRDFGRNAFKDFRLIYIPGGELWEGTEYEEPSKDLIYKVYTWDTPIEEIV